MSLMPPATSSKPLRRLALLALLLAASGCSLFRPERRLDMGPFGENTISMVGEMQKFNRPAPWVYLKKYQGHAKVGEILPTQVASRRLMSGVALYSMQITSLNESRLSEPKRIQALARYLEEIVRPVLPTEAVPETAFSKEELDDVLKEVRKAETFLGGLAAAQPLVNAVQSRGLQLFNRLDEQVGMAASAISGEVEGEFAPLKRNIVELELLQERAMQGVTLLYKYRLGEVESLPALRAVYPPVAEQLPPGRPPTAKQLEAAELELVGQLQRLKLLKEQLGPEFAIYKETQRELEMLRIQAEDRARMGRVTLVLWARSHKNLGLGVAVPPAIDVMGMLKAAGGAVAGSAGKVVPGL
jgi:hypothetical protein